MTVPSASADSLLDTVVRTDAPVARSCVARPLATAPGVVTRTVTMPSAGWVTARLTGSAPGDWDLAIFDRASGRRLAGSASFGSNEVAAGLAAAGDALVVQACRRDGGGDTADLSVDSVRVDTAGTVEKVSIVRVITPTRASKQRLQQLGLDLTEHGGRGFVGVVLHGAQDARKLRQAGFSYTVDIPDLAAQSRRDREADAVFAREVRASALPSGRDSYRTLPDYEADLKALAEGNPDIVKPLVLPHKSGEGRTVNAIEITTDPHAKDGKPVFAIMGAHHAREWPSAEHTIEFAFDLVNGYKGGDARTRRLVAATRTIVIPVVNVDGFNVSRTVGASSDPLTGRGAPNPGEDDETVNIFSHPNEYRRKNCRVPDSDAYNCAGPAYGLGSTGVDPNRNYGALWGGDGAAADAQSEIYRGPEPFSEPDTKNIRDLVSQRHVVTLITNHTFSDLVLRPPGMSSLGLAVDEPQLKALGDAMAAENGYLSLYGWQLYDTSGTTEDWTYGVTGGFGYTFEIGCTNLNRTTNECVTGHFHPPYAEMIKEYDGETPQADEGGRDGKGNREAYFIALESTANTARHSVIEGQAPPGAVLRLRKEFETETSRVLDERGREGDIRKFADKLDTEMVVPASGRFEWHVNPSTRPLVAQDLGTTASGTPSDPIEFSGTPATAPPCGAVVADPACQNEHVFDIPDDPTKDNALAVVRIDWTTPSSDWDMEVFRADAAGNPVGPAVTSSGQGTTPYEQGKFIPTPGKYVVLVNNFGAAEPYTGSVSFRAKPPFRPGRTESWAFSCESAAGTSTQALQIARGERRTLDLSAACRPPAPPAGGSSTTPATARCVDRSAPVSSILRRSMRVSRIRLTLSGTSRDRGCGARGAGLVRRVFVAVHRSVRGGCRYLQANGRLSLRRRCNRPILLRAGGASRWRYTKRVFLPRGRYMLWVVGRDARGNQEGGRRVARRSVFRVR
ncbi:MAG TPA: M14 family zinc carboxypeptidase [Solirubrobacteraceae bacterium]|nr:M14 family zinc carboxypeptidase [Solirubrobacteraceae bacterium]